MMDHDFFKPIDLTNSLDSSTWSRCKRCGAMRSPSSSKIYIFFGPNMSETSLSCGEIIVQGVLES